MTRKLAIIATALLSLLGIVLIALWQIPGCTCASKQATSEANSFTPPTIPALLTSPEQRATFLVSHYWDTYNFADTALVRNPDITEQAFSTYISFFAHTTPAVVAQGIAAMLMRAIEADSTAFAHFAGLYERYLDDPNSPFRNEEHYIPVLQTIIAAPQVDELLKLRPRYRLEKALQNLPNTLATDFTYTLPNGDTGRLSEVQADLLILFFNNPDCHDCARVKEILAQMTSSERGIKILAIYPDSDLALWRKAEYPSAWVNARADNVTINRLYDLRAIPTLYLLDRNKRVLLKDAAVEVVIQAINNIQQ